MNEGLAARGYDGLITDISAADDMYAVSSESAYFRAGEAALDCVKGSFSGEPQSVLDFGCGHGRVLRFLRAGFPEAQIVASDIDKGAVDFCVETFGVAPLYSAADPAGVRIDQHFDLIWSGSLFTHLDERPWREFLALLVSSLSPSGILVFTTSGKLSVDEMEAGQTYGLTVEDAREVVRSFREVGFAYADYPGHEYGIARCSPAWVCKALEDLPVRLTNYTELGWIGRQDVVVLERVPDHM